jgi:hypothetical protein
LDGLAAILESAAGRRLVIGMPPQEFLHRDLVLFIAEYIRSVEQLEVLILTSAAVPTEWSIEAVYETVKTNRASIAQRLKDLTASGLLVEVAGDPVCYRFQPRTERQRQLVADLASAYKRASVRVIETIYSPSTASLREFARAFRLKPDQPDK